MAKKPLEIDMIAGSQLRDTQGEMLSVEGADITDLLNGNGRLNDNHGKGFFNSIGRVTGAKKILKAEDCENDRHRYFWEKVKAPYIYVKGILYDDDEHPNAKAAAAILRNIHKSDTPLKLKASVEGGVVARGSVDERLLARTKIHSVALTFTPANNATLVEPISLEKSDYSSEQDAALIKSVMHLAKTDVPSFRHITRRAQAEKIAENLQKANQLAAEAGLKTSVPNFTADELIVQALEYKIEQNVLKINELVKNLYKTEKLYHIHKDGYRITTQPVSIKDATDKYGSVKRLESSGHILVPHEKISKALTAGYGGASAPTMRTGGAVLQAESLDDGRKGFNYITCDNCGHEQVHMKHQVKCRSCNSSYSMKKLYRFLANL